MSRLVPSIIAAASVAIASTAVAAPVVPLDVPAGRLAEAVAAIGRQARVSISVSDSGLWQRRVPALRGRMTPRAALDRIVRGLNADIVEIDDRTLRIVARPSRSAPAALPRPIGPAQPPPTPEAPPIVVTGSKRDMLLRTYPGMASLIDGETLAPDGARGTEAIVGRLPGISSTHLGSGRNKLFIRGIADSSFTGPTQATVGQYVGDIRLTYNAPDPDLRLYDIRSVEVLEGPQGTLYGAGSLGGVIRVVRNPPRLEQAEAMVSAGVSATQHGDPGVDIGGMINLPLGERVALRAVGYGLSDGGYIDDVLLGRHDVNRMHVAGGRATLRVDIGNGWLVDLGGTIQRTRGEDSQYADSDRPPLTRASHISQPFTAHYRLGEVVIGKEWDGIRFLSSTGFSGQDLTEHYDATAAVARESGLPVGMLAGAPAQDPGDAATPRLFHQRTETRLISSENRVWRPMRDGFGWVIGISLVDNRTRVDRALGPANAQLPVTGVTNRIREATIYGEASMELARGVTATAGGRFTHAKLSGAGEDVAPLLAADRAQVTAGRHENAILPSIAVSAVPLPSVSLFARYQEGFRPGGLAIESEFVRRFRNDRVATLEAGFRYGSPVDPFDVSGSVSHTRWSDIQADFIDATGLPSTANIGDGRIWSYSVTMGWRPLPGLAIDASVAFNNSKVIEPAPLFLVALARMSRIPNVARHAGRIGAEYATRLSDAFDLRVAASARYVGRSRLGIGPELGEAQGDYLDTMLTARIGWPGFGVTIGLTNLADATGNRFALGTPFVSGQARQITPLRPRTLRIGIDAAF